MAKSVRGLITVGGHPVQARALPDVFDQRDLSYRPMLQMLPQSVDGRAVNDRFVMTQKGESCTGHAVAAMINAVQAKAGDKVHVSPYMLYALGRRYDEFPGSADAGSSLRGVLKGWYYHGVLPDRDWPKSPRRAGPDIDNDTALAERAFDRPLGAFYRVNAFRLDDMQSAINELNGIVASAAIHDGWRAPEKIPHDDRKFSYVIKRSPGSENIGGHAFGIVGYNDVGFLVQNSWGKNWGKGGFATLTYDDWLESAYDVWVARPGVRSNVSTRNRNKITVVSGTAIGQSPGPDVPALAPYVVNLGNDGHLSSSGRFISTTGQVEKVFTRMAAFHEQWRLQDQTPGIVIYAHGGLDGEDTGLGIAQAQRNWWLNNHLYPISFVWETGASETLMDQIKDLVRDKLPFGGLLDGVVEQFDRLVERAVQSSLRWAWAQMKQNAVAASQKDSATAAIDWSKALDPAVNAQASTLPGASLVVSRLAKFMAETPGAKADVHLVGHSAGSIFLGAMLDRLADAKIPVKSLTYLAPAIRTDEFLKSVQPHLGKNVEQFTSFAMSDALELADNCGGVYHKSLLYLVSRAFEPEVGEHPVPIVGMQRYATTKVSGTTYADAVASVGGSLVWSPSQTPTISRSLAHSHGGFDNDSATMTSVMLRVLGKATIAERNVYAPNAGRLDPDPPPASQNTD
jgi:hypothetical protein